MDDAPRPRSDAAAPPERGGLLDRLDGFQRRHPAAGLPLAVLYKFFDDRGPYLAALLTYYVFVSLFPLLLLLFSALGFFLQGHPALRHDIQHSALSNFPVVGTKLSRNVGSFRGSGAGLVIGILGTLYGGLGAMQAAQFGFNWIYGVPRNKQPNALRSRLRSIGLVALLGSGVLLSTGIAVVLSTGNEISQVLGPVVETGGYLLSYIINVALFSVAFQLLTARELQIRQVLTGGMIAAGAWMLLQVFGTTVLSARLSRTNALYGVFAVVLTTILWLYLQSLILMLAAEINVVRHRRLWPRALLAPFTDEVELTDADRRTYAMYPAAQQFKGFQTISTRFTPEGDARVGGAPDGDARGGARPPGTGERNGGRPSSSARAVPSRSDASR